MNTTNMNDALCHGSTTSRLCERKLVKKMINSCALGASDRVSGYMPLLDRRKRNSTKSLKNSNFSAYHIKLLTSSVVHRRRRTFSVIRSTIGSDSAVESYDVEESSDPKEEVVLNGKTSELLGTSVTSSKNIKKELIALALPALAGQAFDPFAQLLETAFIGRLGSVELASAGVSISIFNIISKLFNIPLLSVATSFVAEDLSKIASFESTSDVGFQREGNNCQPLSGVRKQLPSVSTALLLAGAIGIFEAVALYCGSGMFINLMGISSASPMRIPAQQFLALRALGAPAVVVSLAIQGIFRGFKDTKTPLICLGAGNLTAVFLLPIFMYSFRLGVIGAAIATVISQYIVTIMMIWFLNKRAILLPPKMENLRFGGYLKSGGFLIGRTLAILMTMTLGTSMAARQGPMPMAAHQICLQVWLAVSLLTDALAASGQAMIASSFSKGDYKTVKEITFLLLKTGLLAGVVLALLMGASFGSIATLFTNDVEVLRIVKSLLLFVCATQPLNALAFIADGLYYGVSDFAYACRSMMVVGVISSVCFLYAPSILGLTGVWWGLALCMGLRVTAGYLRLMSKTGPWWFLHKDIEQTEVCENKIMLVE